MFLLDGKESLSLRAICGGSEILVSWFTVAKKRRPSHICTANFLTLKDKEQNGAVYFVHTYASFNVHYAVLLHKHY